MYQGRQYLPLVFVRPNVKPGTQDFHGRSFQIHDKRVFLVSRHLEIGLSGQVNPPFFSREFHGIT